MTKAIERLRRFTLLDPLDAEEIGVLAVSCEARTVERGEYLFHEGDADGALYFACEGTLVADKLVDPSSGDRKDLAILAAPALVGEIALVDHGLRSAGVRAEIRSQMLRLDRAEFERLGGDRPALALKLMRALYLELSRRLRNTNDELVAVHDIGKLVATASRLEEVAPRVLDRLLARPGVAMACVAGFRQAQSCFEILQARGEGAVDRVGVEIPVDDPLVGTSFRDRKPVLVERLLGPLSPWEGPSMLIVPLLVHDAGRGVLIACTAPDTSVPLRLSDLTLAAAVGNLAAPALVGVQG